MARAVHKKAKDNKEKAILEEYYYYEEEFLRHFRCDVPAFKFLVQKIKYYPTMNRNPTKRAFMGQCNWTGLHKTLSS